jgi:hypothetical protein
VDESSQDWRPSGTDYVYNIKSRVVHRRVDGRTYESCNVDQIVRLTRSHDLMMIIRMHKGAVFCKRCFRVENPAMLPLVVGLIGLTDRMAAEEPDGA